MTELGDTHDLRRHANPDDDRARFEALDRRVQRWGRWSVIAGVSIVIANTMGALVAAVATENGLFEDETARLFAILVFVNVSLAGLAGIIVGSIEKYQRPFRAYRTADADTAEHLNTKLDRIAIEQRELYENIDGRVAALPHLLNLLTERVGSSERHLHALITALPEHLQRQHWQGYNAAVRDNFSATGTYGTPQQGPPRLGLVPTSDPNNVE